MLGIIVVSVWLFMIVIVVSLNKGYSEKDLKK